MRKGLITLTTQALEIEETNSSFVVRNILEDSDIFDEIAAHQAKYFERMDDKAVHNSKYEFKVEENVFLKKDFDANASTVRKKLDSFYHKMTEIIEILSRNRLKLLLEGKTIVVSMQIVKKVPK
ncbi:hypothetical protein DMUE_1758 [Dictyocoela muelleri]|nr:hypothetical protein DMUE_1758 [Dictyocoela muelleri]